MKVLIIINVMWMIICFLTMVLTYRSSIKTIDEFSKFLNSAEDRWSERCIELNESWSERCIELNESWSNLLKKFTQDMNHSIFELAQRVLELEERMNKYEKDEI